MKPKFRKKMIIKPLYFIYDGPFLVLEKHMGKYLLMNVKSGVVFFKSIKTIDENFIREG